MTAHLRVISAITDKLRLNAAYTYSDRDNKTPQSTYNWVTTDYQATAPRTNLPYSFTQSDFELKGDYRVTKDTKLGIGFESDTRERTFQEAAFSSGSQ